VDGFGEDAGVTEVGARRDAEATDLCAGGVREVVAVEVRHGEDAELVGPQLHPLEHRVGEAGLDHDGVLRNVDIVLGLPEGVGRGEDLLVGVLLLGYFHPHSVNCPSVNFMMFPLPTRVTLSRSCASMA